MNRVLLITNIPAPYRVDLFYYMQTHINDFEIHVIYCAQNESNRCWSVNDEKIKNAHYLKTKKITIRKKYDTKYIYIPMNLWEEISKVDPDVIIAWEYNLVALISLLWCKVHKTPYISLTDGTLYSERNINVLQKISRKIISRECSAAIASSSKAKEKLLTWGIEENKIFVSLLTVDITEIAKIEYDPIPGRLLYVGSMIERKGLDLLISALKYVNVDFCLHIVGNGTETEIQTLNNRIKESNLKGTVEFCGFKQGKDLMKEYQQAQIFVFPTREDCFGLVLLEAACAGVPIISSKYADGAYDIIEEGINGNIVDPYDEKAFGRAILRSLDKSSESLDKEKLLDRFSFESVTDGYTEAIRYAQGREKSEYF